MTVYTLDVEGFHRNLLNAGFMVEEMRKRAEAGKAVAEAVAPVDSGQFKSSFEVEAHTEGGSVGRRGNGKRAVGILSNTDPNAAAIEYGHTAPNGSHVEGAYTLTQAMNAMGG